MSFEYARLRAVTRKLSTSAALALAAGLLMAPAPSYADDHGEKVGVCHRTGSETNPYVFIRVSEHAIEDGHGHAGHDDDERDVTSAACADLEDDARDKANKDDNKKNKKKDKFRADDDDDDGDDDDAVGRGHGRGRGHGPPPGRGRGHGHGGPRR